MIRQFAIDLRRFWCRNCLWFLAFFWIITILSGIRFAAASDSSIASLMCSAVCCPVTIVGLIAVLFFPLFISTVAVYFHAAELILLFCGVKGFFLGYCLYGLLLAFGSGGWLVSCLFMFSGLLMQIFLFWFWQLSITENTVKIRAFLICTLLAVVIGCIDYFCVSPFLTLLISKL